MSEQLRFEKETHRYFLGQRQLVSVSKIINNYLGTSYKDVPADVLKNAAIRGQWVHKVNEIFLKNFYKENIIPEILAKLKNKTNEVNYQYCQKSLEFLKNEVSSIKECVFQIETPIYHDWIAGIPDLLINEPNKIRLVDYKTYSAFTSSLKEKAILQMTAYWWILTMKGLVVSKTAEIYWINKFKKEKIKIEITEESLHDWNMAMKSYLEWEIGAK